MLVDFESLAFEAGACPSTDVRLDARPHIAGGDEALGGSYPRMGQAVKRIKNSTSKICRDVGAGYTSGHIT